MNKDSVSSQQHIPKFFCETTFTMLLQSSLDSIFIKRDTKILFALSTDDSIHNQIKKQL